MVTTDNEQNSLETIVTGDTNGQIGTSSAEPSTSVTVFRTHTSIAQRLLAAIKLIKWLEIMPIQGGQMRREEVATVFRALLALSERNHRILFEAIGRNNMTWPDVVQMLSDKQFEV